MPRPRGGVDSNGRINVRIHPIAKARIVAYCEWRTRETGVRYTLDMAVNDYGWNLPPIDPAVERVLRLREGAVLVDNRDLTAQSA